jgi:hypothetical protein
MRRFVGPTAATFHCAVGVVERDERRLAAHRETSPAVKRAIDAAPEVDDVRPRRVRTAW